MASNPVHRAPELNLDVEDKPDQTIVRCSGRIVSETTDSLKAAVKPLFARKKDVVLDVTDVGYMDSSGLGTIVGLYVSATAAHSHLKLVNLNQRLRELFSITRLGELMTEGRDPRYPSLP